MNNKKEKVKLKLKKAKINRKETAEKLAKIIKDSIPKVIDSAVTQEDIYEALRILTRRGEGKNRIREWNDIKI